MNLSAADHLNVVNRRWPNATTLVRNDGCMNIR
jgi:hypothetical protein